MSSDVDKPAKRGSRPGVVGADQIIAGLQQSMAQTEQAAHDAASAQLNQRYPEYLMPIAGEIPDIAERLGRADDGSVEVPEHEEELLRARYERFCDLREEFVADYTYNTARAYWGDLDDLWWWAAERGKDVFALTDKDLTQYVALHRRRGYSDNTIRRRLGTIARFHQLFKYNSQGDP